MFTDLQQWFHSAFGIQPRRRSRRHVAWQCSSAEVLEQRALMSAANGMGGAIELADVSYADDLHFATDMMEATDVMEQPSDAMTVRNMDRSARMGSEKRLGEKTKVEVPDFSGNWFLGFGEDPISVDSTMNVEQNGKKITATIDDKGTTVLVKGKIKEGELRARFVVPGQKISGTLSVTKTAVDKFEGTITLKSNVEAKFTQVFRGSRTVSVPI